jgi:serine/threonine-protein kinase
MMAREMATTARRRSLIGEKIGNYAIVSTLGEGGMGVVYLAEHPILGRRVAIKVLHGDLAAKAEAAARCFVEARAAAGIEHPNVVDVIDCGVAEVGDAQVHYLVMEHLEGRSLREEIKAGAMPVERAIAVALGVARALAAAHDKGIVHRYITPENIFLVAGAGADGERVSAKVLDFGVAKLMDGHPFGGPLTQSGVTLGTPTYMAPEQLDNEDIDGRVDVYALGIVLFEMLTGAAPFAEEPTARGVWRRMNEVPELPPALALPGGVEALLVRAMDPDRVRRPSMSELVRGLADPAAVETDPHTRRVPKAKQAEKVERAEPVKQAEPAREAKPAAAASSRRWLSTAIVGLVLGAAAALIVPKLLRDGDPATSSPATAPSPLPVAASPSSSPSPAPPPAPQRPATVSIDLDSRPSGADVFVGRERRGTTPLKLVLERSTTPTPIVLRRGASELRHSLDTSRDTTLVLAFPASPRSSPMSPPTPAVTPDAAIPATTPDAALSPPTPPTPPTPTPTPPSGLGDNLMQPRERR